MTDYKQVMRDRAVRHYFGPPQRLFKLWVEGRIDEDDGRIDSFVREMYRQLVAAYELGYAQGAASVVAER